MEWNTDAGVQAILQQWSEVRDEQGTVERTYTQCAQSWPLASHVELEGIESAIGILRQACDYLHDGMVRLSSVTDQKCDTGKVQQVTAELMAMLQEVQTRCTEGSQRTETVASRVNEMAGEAVNIRNRLEGLERRVGMEGQQHDVEMRELRAGHEQHEADLRVLRHTANEYQADVQARDHEIDELKELIFNLGVEMDEVREDIKRIQSAPGREMPDAPMYQEQVVALRQSLDRAHQQLETQEQKIREGDQRLSQLQEEVRNLQRMPKLERHEGVSDEVRRVIEGRLAKIEEKQLRLQQQTSGWQEDSVRDFQEVESYLTRLHSMVMEAHQTEATSSTLRPPRMTKLTAAAWKGDFRVEVESAEEFRVGEVVLLGEQEAKMVVDKGSLIFRFPIERDYPEGTVVRPLAENEFIQAEGDRLCVYRRGPEDDIQYVCRVDLLERVHPERVSENDDAQDHAYGDQELEARIQRLIEAREVAQTRGGGVSGVMVPPLPTVPRGRGPFIERPTDLPAFGQGGSGQSRQERDSRSDAGRPTGDAEIGKQMALRI